VGRGVTPREHDAGTDRQDAAALEAALRAVLADEELIGNVSRTVASAFGTHARKGLSEWIGDKIITIVLAAGLGGVLFWLVANGYVGGKK
jgi:hypothetical protein